MPWRGVTVSERRQRFLEDYRLGSRSKWRGRMGLVLAYSLNLQT